MSALDLPPKLWLPSKPAIIRPAVLPSGRETVRATFPFPAFVPSGKLPTVEEFAEQSDGASVSSYSFTGVTLAEGGLFVVRFLVGGTFNATRTAGSVTVGGNAATIVQQGDSGVDGSLNSAVAGLATISLGAGATGNIVININGGLNAAAVAIHPICVRGLVSTTPHHSNSNGVGAATSVSTTLNIPASGIQIVSAASLNGGAAHTATGYTPAVATGTQIDTSFRFQPGYDIGLATQAGRTLTNTGVSSTRRAIAAASWA